MAKTLEFPLLRATFKESPEHEPRGLWVRQNGRKYFARKHLLTDQTEEIINKAVDAGLTAFWAYGHPQDKFFEGGDKFDVGAHQLQFSETHDSPWTFVIGSENKPPNPEFVTFNRKLKPFLDSAATEKRLDKRFEYQVIGGKNITVERDMLAFALEVCTVPEVQDLLAGRSPRLPPKPRCPAYVSEDHLQAAIKAELEARGFRVEREVNLGVGRIDLIAFADERHLLIEVKPHSTGRPVFDQIDRYYRAYSARSGIDTVNIELILIAHNFQDDLVNHVRATASTLKLITYGVDDQGKLVFTGLGRPHSESVLGV